MSRWIPRCTASPPTAPSSRGCFVEGTFTTRNLAPNDIKKVVDEVNKISHKAFGEEKDLIGRVYEYFLKEFAVNATKEEGEYYTPHDVVQLIAAMIEPFDGTLYDPCCGSGGMFIQSAELVKAKRGDISRIAFPTRNLMDVLGHFSSPSVDMILTGAEGPCGIRGSEDNEYTVIIMPMKISESTYYSEEDV